MAQNINLQYVHMPNAAKAKAVPGQVNQLPANSLQGNIDARRPDRRNISAHKVSMGFTLSQADKDLYKRWRQIVKDQMLARNFIDLSNFPDLHFQQIVQGMRRLRPVCDSLVNASAANDVPRMQEVDEAVVQMIKDCGRKLRNSLAHHPAAPPPPEAPAVVPGHLIVPPTLRPRGAPSHWDPAMPGPVVPAPPEPIVPDPVVPEPVVHEPVVPEPVVPNPVVPDPVVPDPVVPEPVVPDPVVPDPVVPDPIVPDPVVPEPVVPEPVVPEPVVPDPVVPDPVVPDPVVPEPVVPEPVVPDPVVPDPVVPDPVVPAPLANNPALPANHLTPNAIPTDWHAQLGRPRAVRIVWVRPSRRADGSNAAPNYHSIHWRSPHTHGIQFAELDSYDIGGLSAMIRRFVSGTRFRYILGATGEGRRKLREAPGEPISDIDYVFINSDETVRAWLLSNTVLEDPLDLLVYCHRDRNDEQPPTPPMRRHAYLGENAVVQWGRDKAACIGQMHFRAPQPHSEPDHGQANEASEQQEGDDSHRSQATLSSSSSDVLETRDGREGREDGVGILSSLVGDEAEPPANRIAFTIKSLTSINRQQPLDLVRRHTPGDKERKRSAQFDEANCVERKSKRIRERSSARLSLKCQEAQKRDAQSDAENCDERKSKRLRSAPSRRV